MFSKILIKDYNATVFILLCKHSWLLWIPCLSYTNKRGSKFNLKIYKKHVSNIFFENYIIVCEITLQRSSDSVDSKL